MSNLQPGEMFGLPGFSKLYFPGPRPFLQRFEPARWLVGDFIDRAGSSVYFTWGKKVKRKTLNDSTTFLEFGGRRFFIKSDRFKNRPVLKRMLRLCLEIEKARKKNPDVLLGLFSQLLGLLLDEKTIDMEFFLSNLSFREFDEIFEKATDQLNDITFNRADEQSVWN